MTDRPILFSGPMVRALIEGRKTQTRRLLLNLIPWDDLTVLVDAERDGPELLLPYAARRFAVGHRLWVREAWAVARVFDGMSPDQWSRAARRPLSVAYEADGAPHPNVGKLRPSIHMPRVASRLTLTVADVRVQRLQEISPADAIAEGISPAANSQTIDCDTPNPVDAYRDLWDSLNAKRAPWASNPWVVAVSFTVEQRNIDA